MPALEVGTITASAPDSASVGVTSAQAVAFNSARKGLTVVNISSNFIYLGLDGATASLYKGIALSPNGVWSMDDYSFTLGQVNAIASGAASTLTIQEFTT